MTNPAHRASAWDAPAQQRKLVRLVVAGVILVAVSAMLAISVRRYFTVSESRLPDLVGLRFDEAARMLRRSHLEPVAFAEDAPGVAADTVTSQAPEAGTIVKHGRTISLGVNTPSAAVRVPRLVGMAQADAIARATEVHLVVPSISYQFAPQAAGTVIAQDPEGEAALAYDQRLSLIVSKGPEPATVVLPDLLGVDVDAAVEQLRQLGIHRVETAASDVSFDRPRSVIGMRPTAGNTVPTGTPVALFYSLSALNVVQVPGLAGMPLWRAQLALQAARLSVGRVTYVQEPDKPEGVLTASPWAYTVPGTPIDLTVNGVASTDPLQRFPDFMNPATNPSGQDGRGLEAPGSGVPGAATSTGRTGQSSQATPGAATPGGDASSAADTVPAGGRRVPFTFDPSQMGVKRLLESRYNLTLVVTDDRGERTLLDSEVEPGAVVSTSVIVFGDAPLLQTFIDGVFFQAWRP